MHKMLSHWVETVVYGPDGPQPYPLLDNQRMKMVLVGLEPGQQIPSHPAPQAVYYFIEGNGWMTINDGRFKVRPGVIVRIPEGANRGIEATSRLVFLGAHGKHDDNVSPEAARAGSVSFVDFAADER